MKHRIKNITAWLLLAPLLLFLSYGPANSAISTGGGGAAITGAASTIATADLTASRVLVSNSSGKVAVSTVTSTTLGYLDATSSIQTQLNGKAASSHSHAASDITSGILGATYGGTGNGFTAFTGPTTSTKTFTLPNASAVILTDNALVTAAQGGTGNGYTEFTGPTTIKKTFTLPNASATILTDNAAVTVAQGGTGQTTLTNHYVLVGAATSGITAVSPSTSGYVLTSNGAGSDPSFQAPASGYTSRSYIRRSNGCTTGSTNNKIFIYGTAKESGGSDITYQNSAANGDSFKINTAGIYRVAVNFYQAAAPGGSVEIRVKASLENTAGNGTETSIRGYHNPVGNGAFTMSSEFYASVNDLIWIAANGTTINSSYPELYQVQISGPY